MTNRTKALAAVIACMLFWGFSFISIKIAVAVFPPMTLGALRFTLALIFLFFLKKKIAPKEKASGKDLVLLACVGLTGVTLYFFFENNGVLLIPASEASIITGAIPVITMVAETVRERIISRQKERGRVLEKIILPGLGALISLTGVALVAGVSFVLSGTALGYLYMAGACVCWVCYCFLTSPLFARHSRIFIVFWQSAAGFIGFLPFAFYEVSKMQNFMMPGIEIWGHIIFLGVFCSALGYWFYAQSLEVLGIGTTSLFINFIPVISAIGGYLVLGERLRPLQLLGAALVLAGVYLAMAAQRIAGRFGLLPVGTERS
ncbi:MAG: DMT family transporter [Treponema sp.]|jgi:drug/metabolite transporter (DMT)-like permease|nr:DMT family transporter [Treponema sp.]